MTGAKLTNEQFERFGSLIRERWGIKMPANKRVMLESRLLKRLRGLDMSDFDEYAAYLFNPDGLEKELTHLIEVVSTNKTDFFREPKSFDQLARLVLDDWQARAGTRHGEPLRVWSAGCSTGEEPYTLAMIMAEFAARRPAGPRDFLVLATDVSPRVLAHARTAVYSEERAREIPSEYRNKYLLRSRDRSAKAVRIAPEIRKKVKFHHLNLMDDFRLRQKVDAIFCRNVIIYFDRDTQQALVRRLCAQLVPGGHLFMGHSETLNGLTLPVVSVAPTVYRKVD